MDTLSAEAWGNPVASALGQTVPATEIPWMRTREVWVHAVDLDADVDFADFPAGLLEELITEVTALRSTRRPGPELLVRSTDTDDVWRVAGTGPVVTVAGTRANLARWVTGRGAQSLDCSEGPLPELEAWL
jgi:maleylpyruvate isomerase